MIKNKTYKLTVSGLLLALGIILPYALAHGMRVPGTVLLPMHIPVLLSGFLCGPLHGAICGAALPLLNCFLTGMPSLFPMLPIMLAELTTYGLVSGLIFNSSPIGRLRFGIYLALPIAMICGRAAYSAVFYSLLLTVGDLKALSVWAAIATGLPGIIIQLIVIPQVILVIKKASGRKISNEK